MTYIRLSFAKKKMVVNFSKFWGIIGLMILLVIIDVFWFIPYGFSAARRHPITIINFLLTLPILLLIIWLFVLILNAIGRKIDKQMDSYIDNYVIAKKGDKGEKLVYERLTQHLNPTKYRIFSNIKLPTMKSDIDLLILGEKGIYIIEIKNYDKTKTIYQSPKTSAWLRGFDLRSRVKWQGEQLEKYLAEQGFDNINVHKAIVYLNPASVEIKGSLKSHHKVYIALGLEKLVEYLNQTYINRKFTSNHCLAIQNVLDKLNS